MSNTVHTADKLTARADYDSPRFSIYGVGGIRVAAKVSEHYVNVLIAAPDLLQSLLELMEEEPYDPQLGNECECGEFVDYVPLSDEAPSCRHTRARAVIARATGKTP